MLLERFNLTPAQFNAIPDAERALMVLLAHGLNEVNALKKLVTMSMNRGLFLKHKIGQKYLDTADTTTIAALDKINKYFGPGSKVSKIRNQQAFHYIREQGLTKVDVDQPEVDLALYPEQSTDSK